MNDVVWSDLRCPECGAQTYGPLGHTVCEAGHEAVSMVVPTEADWCGVEAPEGAAAKGVQPCVHPPGHKGGHVWWQSVTLAGGRFSVLWYYEQVPEGARPVVHLDLRGRGITEQVEAAAMWQYLELVRAKRAAARAAQALYTQPDDPG